MVPHSNCASRFKHSLSSVLPTKRSVGEYTLQANDGFSVASGEGVHVGEDEVLGAVGVGGGLVLALDDGEGAEDVGDVVAGDAVEVEVAGIEAGAEVGALAFLRQTELGFWYRLESVMSSRFPSLYFFGERVRAIQMMLPTAMRPASAQRAVPRFGSLVRPIPRPR